MICEEKVLEYQESNNEAILNELFDDHKRLIGSLIWKFRNSAMKVGVDPEDLEQEAWIAFYDAIKKFDNRGSKFSTFSYIVVKYSLVNLIKKAIQQIPCIAYDAENEDGWTLGDTIGFVDDYGFEGEKEETSKLKHLRIDLFTVLDSVFPKSNHSDFSFVGNADLMNMIINGISGRDVLIKHFGLDGITYNYDEIAAEVGVSKQCIIQVEERALNQIRKSEAGKILMKKYENIMVDYWEFEKDKISQIQSPELAIERTEIIDDILIRILKSVTG